MVSDPTGGRAFVMDDLRNRLAIVDATSLRVVARVPVAWSTNVARAARDPATGLLFVVRTGGVSVVDPDTARVVREGSFAPAVTLGDVDGVAIGGGRLWIADGVAGLLILDMDTLRVVDRIGRWPGGSLPIDVVIDMSRSRAYVASADRLAVIDTTANEVVRCLRLGGSIAFDPRRDVLYVASARSDSGAALLTLDPGSLEVAAILRAGLVPVDVNVDPRTGRVYVVDQGAYNVETVDDDAGIVWVVGPGGRLLRTLAIGISPVAAALGAAARVLFIATHAGTLSRLPLSRSVA